MTLPPQSGSISAYKMGFAGPQYRDQPERPDWDTFTFSIGPRIKASDFTADEFADDGGGWRQDTRDIAGYTNQAVTWTITRHHNHIVFATQWAEWTHNVPWAYVDQPEPDDWTIENPTHSYYPPWHYTDCLPYQHYTAGFPFCTPRIFSGYWTDYTNCLDSSNYGGTCPTHTHLNPWANCPTCVGLGGIWGISGFPVGLSYVLATVSGNDLAFGASLTHAATWQRAGSFSAYQYMGQLIPSNCTPDFLEDVAKRWLHGTALPYTDWRVGVLSAEPDILSTTDSVTYAFEDLKTATWSVTGYTPPIDPLLGTGEILPKATLDAVSEWENTGSTDITPTHIVVIAHKGAHDQVLFWSAITAPAVVHPTQHFKLTDWVFKIGDLLGNFGGGTI